MAAIWFTTLFFHCEVDIMTDMQQVQQVERYSKTLDLMTVDKFPVNIMMEHTYM